MSLVLTKGEIDEIGEKVQEVIAETWNKVNGRYKMTLTYVQHGIVELKVLAQTTRQLK